MSALSLSLSLSSNVSISVSIVEFDSQSVNSEWIQPQAAGHRNLFRNEIKILDWPDMELSASLAPDSRDQAVDCLAWPPT